MKKVLITILTFLIVLTVALWVVIIYTNLDRGNPFWERSPAVEETAAPDDDEIVVTPAPTVAPTPTPPAEEPEPDENGEGDDEQPEQAGIAIMSMADSYPDIRRELNALSERYDSAAVSLVAYNYDTGEFFTYEYGMADIEDERAVNADTKFYIASLSKLVTAICTMSLVDDGHLDLDADLTTYLGYEIRNPNFPEIPITARMLLNHTSSLFDSGAFRESKDRNSSESVKELIERETSFRRSRPGTRFEYSNFGYAVLGALCERVSGVSLDTLAHNVIFEPLGIDASYLASNLLNSSNIAVIYDSSHRVSRSVETQMEIEQSSSLGHDLHLAQENLTISAVDYAKIMAMLGNGGEFDGTVILSQDAVNEMFDAAVQGQGYLQGLGPRYSEDDFIDGEGFFWHPGSAYGVFSQFILSASPSRGVVVITTGASTERLENNMIDNCTEMSLAAWKIFDDIDSRVVVEEPEEEEEEEPNEVG